MSGTPSSGDVTVALDALRSDSWKWSAASANAITAQSAVDAQTLTMAQFSCYADAQGLTQTYDALQQRIRDLLGQASANFVKISTTLQQVAQTYQDNEHKITNSFNRIHH